MRAKPRLLEAIKLKDTDEIARNMEMYYSEDYPYNNGYFSEFEEFIEAWKDRHEPDEPKPKYVWGTTAVELTIDAGDILENACDELHEGAYDNLSDVEGLQKYLDEWCAKQRGTTTYYQDCKYAIEIPWGI